ncbi:hypothetical protein [Sporichthya polymorpha]|uniref:hypothetical protein n=1 Tax=Sporichthya polymorpha TaxID=35751 RepID=UPI0003609AAC|nr:hypothetical protein [Sporichthya polymorpha]
MTAVTPTLHQRAQAFWIYAGLMSVVAFTIGWVGLEGFLPPLAPSDGPEAITQEFEARATGIRLGAIFMIVGTMFWVPWATVVAAQTRSTEGVRPVNAWTQIGSAAVATAVIIMGQMFWIVAAFRDRSPEITQLLSDMGFICEILPFIIFVVWNIALTWSIFLDDRAQPAYPRWAAYFSLWCALLYVPGGCLAFFYDGPFAWDGALAFYLPAIAFFVWFLGFSLLTLQAIKRQPSIDGHAEVPAAEAPTAPVGVA